MKITVSNLKFSMVVMKVSIAGVYALASMTLLADDVQVGRYSLHTVTPTEAQLDLLATTVTIQVPKRIQTVGEAIRYLLQRSGYRLAKTEITKPDTVVLFALPLPAVHRNLGPITLRGALETLAGPAFKLVQDRFYRCITFERSSIEKPVGPVVGVDTEAAQDEERSAAGAAHSTLLER